MRVISVNIGLPREVIFNGQVITTGIFKDPVQGRIKLRKLNFEGDKQADLTVHGGIDKAVYSYPAEHYDYWRKQVPNIEMSWGIFGENLTTEGLIENAVNIGDRFEIGSSKVVVTQPRMPCYKLGIRFGRMDIIKRFMSSGRPGIYFKVLREGEVCEGDDIKLISRDENNVSVRDIVRLYISNRDSEGIETMRRAIRIRDLPEGWRYHFQEQIEQLESE